MQLTWERALLVLLILGSTSIFVRNLAVKLRVIFRGAGERTRTNNPGARLVRTIREVFLQSRVVRGRPVVGALHAVVFLGFLLFAPETVEHFLKGMGWSLLEPLLGSWLPVYRAAMQVIAILVGLGIAGLAFRRFVLVRTSPDPRSWTSGIVALFIFLLMLTYLNGMRETPVAAQANWWIHALIILAFPHLIIKSKHFHILLAPVSVFLRTERLGEYAPLDLESLAESDVENVTLGLENIASLPWKMRLDFMSCVECRRCTDNCPSVLAGNHESDPRALVLAGRKALFESEPDAPVVGTIVGEEPLGFCATCGACENSCAVGVEHLQLFVGAKRAQALATGKGVVASDYFRAIESHGNAFRLPRSERTAMIDELGLPRFREGADQWLLWLGCVWGFNPDQRPAVKALKAVLDAAGTSYGVLDEEPCCGHHSRRQGEESQFQDLAHKSLELFEKEGVHKVLTACPHCLHTLRWEHSQFNGHLHLEFAHHTQLLARLVNSGALPSNGNGNARIVATYHDPCYLARYEKIWEAPRAVLGSMGVSIRELPHRQEKTLCCGGGAAGFVREQQTGQRLDKPRRAEIRASGAGLLVTACPECRMMLDATVDQTKDIAEVIAQSLHLLRTETVASDDSVGKGGQMLTISYSEDLAARILDVFTHCPRDEMQLLNVAGKTHFSGKLTELRHAADHLVETGNLMLNEHGGGRYYKLGKPPAS